MQQGWVSKVEAYDFDIEYVWGKHNVVVDALSKRLERLSLMSICHDWKAQLLVDYSKDRQVCEILEHIQTDEHCWVMAELIYYKGLLGFGLIVEGADTSCNPCFSIVRASGVQEDVHGSERALHMEGPQEGRFAGKDCIYVVANWLTKYAHFFAILTWYSASKVAELFFREAFYLHGLPKTIVSDKDS
eukprot:PITA_17916